MTTYWRYFYADLTIHVFIQYVQNTMWEKCVEKLCHTFLVKSGICIGLGPQRYITNFQCFPKSSAEVANISRTFVSP